MLALRSTRRAALLAAALLLPVACASAPDTTPESRRSYVDDLGDGPSDWPTLGAAIDAADVVYVGETHDDRAHHELELRVLERMASGRGPLLLGMEMFQRPYQQHLDDYVAGRIDENEMLRRTEYFTRWKFDHTFYAPLWRLCRAKGIRIVALNAPAEVQSKIGREGLDALTDDERARIAAEHVLDNAAYNERTRAIFNRVHPMPEPRLTYLVEAQTNWDETMAESGARALAETGPGARLLVVAGSLHIRGRFCIPERLARRAPGLEHLLILGKTEGRFDEADAWTAADADFAVVYTEDRSQLAARLEEVPDGLRVVDVLPGGTAALGGLVAGDVITTLDGRPIRDLVDLRHVLDALPPGRTVPCYATRDGTLYTFTLNLRPAPPQSQPMMAMPARP